MKAVVAAFNVQPGEGPSRGLLHDYEHSDGTFQALVWCLTGRRHGEVQGPPVPDEVGGERHQHLARRPQQVHQVTHLGVEDRCKVVDNRYIYALYI